MHGSAHDEGVLYVLHRSSEAGFGKQRVCATAYFAALICDTLTRPTEDVPGPLAQWLPHRDDDYRASPVEFRGGAVALVRAGKDQKQTATELSIYPVMCRSQVADVAGDHSATGAGDGITTPSECRSDISADFCRRIDTMHLLTESSSRLVERSHIAEFVACEITPSNEPTASVTEPAVGDLRMGSQE